MKCCSSFDQGLGFVPVFDLVKANQATDWPCGRNEQLMHGHCSAKGSHPRPGQLRPAGAFVDIHRQMLNFQPHRRCLLSEISQGDLLRRSCPLLTPGDRAPQDLISKERSKAWLRILVSIKDLQRTLDKLRSSSYRRIHWLLIPQFRVLQLMQMGATWSLGGVDLSQPDQANLPASPPAATAGIAEIASLFTERTSAG
jgi:hypothetical protein